ncbi:phosphoribosylanthranilate isomerase [bacterium]|nr:MAG: phosphoribosylanthranilate isomerase [bacterium]
MTPSLKIKVCGITRLQDASAACSLGVDLLGFNFVPVSRRYLNPYTARNIIDSLPPFISKVGIFADEDLAVVNDLADFLDLDAAQLHGTEDEVYCRRVKIPVVKAIHVDSPHDLVDLERYQVSGFLLDTKVEGELGGTGQTFPWKYAIDLCRRQRVIVAGGLTPDNVGEAVRTLSPYGVDTASGVEISPGIKDTELMEQFVRAARCAAAGNGGKCSGIAC